MKKAMTLGLFVLLTLFFASCAPAGVKSGAAAGEALIKLLPEGTIGVMAVDVQRMMGTEAAVKVLEDPKAREKYDEFVKMSGIDPMKDITYVGFGLIGGSGANFQEGGAVINLKYDKAKLLGLMKEKAPEIKEETYNGVVLYSNLDGSEAKQTTRAAFLDDEHIVLGGEKAVKGIIDVHQKKADSLAKSAVMSAILKKVDMSGFAWGAFAVPQELLKKGIEVSPQFKVLEGVTALTLALDFKLATFSADIRALGGTKEQNADLASALNGFKALGAMFAAQEPVAGEALNGIEISSGPDYTRISVSLPEEVMDKFGKLAHSKAGEFMKKGAAPAEEKK
jgi:hypothetical protein